MSIKTYNCISCGKKYQSNAKRRDYCSECNRDRNKRLGRVAGDNIQPRDKTKDWTVVEDPCEYPLESGLKLGMDEITWGLRYESFVNGFTVKKGNDEFVVNKGKLIKL